MFDDAPPATHDFLPLPQSAPYAVAMRACGARVIDTDLGCGTAQVIRRGRLQLIHRGPVWVEGTPAREQRCALRRLARWPGITLCTPQDAIRGPGLIPLVTPMHHAIWDLSCDLRAGLDGKWRNRLSAAERAGIVLSKGGAKTLSHLIAAEGQQRKQRGYRAHPDAFTRALPADSLAIWQWRDGGRIGAGMVFVRHGASASYHLSWAGAAARQSGVHNVMLWHAARSLQAEGVRWLDLGSVNDEEAPGLARFKLGTGARLHRLGSTLLVLPG